MAEIHSIARDVDSLRRFTERGAGNGDGGGGSMEARVARLEAHVEHIDETLTDIKQDIRDIRSDLKEVRGDARTDFRLLFAALIAVAVGLAGLMAKGFGWLS